MGTFKRNQLEFMKDMVCVKKSIQYQCSTVFNYDEVVGDKYKLSKEIKGFSQKNMVEHFEFDYPTLNKILIKL